MIASTHNYRLYTTTFVRVTELLDDPTNPAAIGMTWIEELSDYFPEGFDDSVTVVAMQPVTAEELERDEIEYVLTVLTTPEVAAFINGDADEVFTLEEITDAG